MILSIVIPVYNTGEFLNKCVESCLNQDISENDYEIIILNDGSTDDSYDVAQSIASKHSNIMLLTHENRGLSETRNRGLEVAKGDYIWFIDSDDWIRPNCLKKILKECTEKDLEAYQVAACNVYETREERIYNVLGNNVSTGLDIMNSDGFYVCAPFTIYKRSFLIQHELRFYPRIFHEDCEFSSRSYYFLKKVSGTNEVIYYVYNNVNSITHTINPKRLYDLLFVIKRIDEFSSTFDERTRLIYSKLISYYLNLIFRFGNELPHAEKMKLKDAIWENKKYLRHYKKSGVFKYWVEGVLFGLFPRRSLDIFKFLQK